MEARAQREPEAARLARIRLLALDVDGVLTDGRILCGPAVEHEIAIFDVRDGIALRWLQAAGVAVAWISGRGSPAVEVRAAELGIGEVHLRVASKRACLAEMQERLGVPREETAAMGDDLPDLGLRVQSGFFVAPCDARPEVCESADLVTHEAGGRGAVRELCERLLRARGRWQAVVDAARR